MAPASKKRKLTTDGEPTRSKHLSKKEIQARLSQCREGEIVKALRDAVKKATPTELHTIESLLGPLLQEATTQLHCVRCHREYTEASNNKSACTTDHDPEQANCSRYGRRWVHTFGCCGKDTVSDDFDDWGNGKNSVCFRGSHTTDPKNYTADHFETCITCKDNGHVPAAEEDSEFGSEV
ncbi:hypothetical protein RhiJN_19012 [Ceratobasidium sp. AG-Ba]|nr:hypothetical protein RhiJN_19012 [Ceratobasidium sp. AG-Ba]